MSRRVLSRARACFTVMFLAAVLSTTSGWTPSSIMSGGSIALFSILAIASPAIPVALLVGLFGLYALLGGGSSTGKWGLAASAVSILVLFTLSMAPYFLYSGNSAPSNPDFIWSMLVLSSVFSTLQAVLLATGLVLLYAAARRRGVLGPWRPLFLAIGFTAVLAVAAPVVLPELGLPGGSTLAQASAIVSGLLWMVLGVSIWRHAPPAGNRNANTAPISSSSPNRS